MSPINFNFAQECMDFDYSPHLSGLEREFYGTPYTLNDIPFGEIYDDADLWNMSILGMHQTVTENNLWRISNINEFKDSLLNLTGPKIDHVGHSGASFLMIVNCMLYIKKHGWNNFIIKCASNYNSR